MALAALTTANAEQRHALSLGELWHYATAPREQIVLSELAGDPGAPNALIHLSASLSWQLGFWAFVRDASVWDPDVFAADDYGRYLYMFFGEPTALTRRLNVQNATLRIRIPGASLVKAVPPNRLFYRDGDKVVAIRGDYLGPAVVEPMV